MASGGKKQQQQPRCEAGSSTGSGSPAAGVPLSSFHTERTRDLRSLQPPLRLTSAKALHGDAGGGHVLYWMKTAVRGHENPALDVARAQAAAWGCPLVCASIAFTGSHTHPTQRRLTWLLQGLRDTQLELRLQGLELFVFIEGSRQPADPRSNATAPEEAPGGEGAQPPQPPDAAPEGENSRGGQPQGAPAEPLDAWATLRALCSGAALVVTEEMPTPPYAQWNQRLVDMVDTEVWGVDTACVYPMRLNTTAPVKAYTYRSTTKQPRLQRLDRLPYTDRGKCWSPFLAREGAAPPEAPQRLPESAGLSRPSLDLQQPGLDLRSLLEGCEGVDHSVPSVSHITGGSAEGYARWEHWRRKGGLKNYASQRNTAMKRDGVSRMSAYLHFGMVSPFKVARDARAEGSYGANKFLDEFFTWRGVAYAFCFHSCPILETLQGLPQWARDTLARHEGDARDLKTDEQLDRGSTGDALWDAMQHQLVTTGELHNNSRMTWGKMVLGWTPSPSHALRLLCHLNHRYALDGCDPCSYGGILWCFGLFDRPMAAESTPIYGKLRQRSTRQIAGRLSAAAYKALPVSPFRGEDNSQQSLRAVLSKAEAGGGTPAKRGVERKVVEAADDMGDEDWEAVREALGEGTNAAAAAAASAGASEGPSQQTQPKAQQAQQTQPRAQQAQQTQPKAQQAQQGAQGAPQQSPASPTPKRKRQATLDGLFSRKASKA